MKKVLFALLFFMTSVALYSARINSPIVGQWEHVKQITEYYELGQLSDTQTVKFDIVDGYWKFTKSGRCQMRDNYGKHKGKFSIVDKNLRIERKGLPIQYYTINKITDSLLEIQFEEEVFDKRVVTRLIFNRKK